MASNLDNQEDPIHPRCIPRALPKRGAIQTLCLFVQGVPDVLNPYWRAIFVFSCVIAVSVDPLFLYLPVIDEKNKCLGMDQTLKVVALVLRSTTDTTFIVNIFCQIWKARSARKAAMKLRENQKTRERRRNKSSREMMKNKPDERSQIDRNASEKSVRERSEIVLFAQKLPWLTWLSIVNDIWAVLPIPQVVIVLMRRSKYLDHKKTMNVILLAQYMPRAYRAHHSSKELTENSGIWAKGAVNLFLYIIASHMLGAFWYFFSIIRETSCWHWACTKHSTTDCNFYCDEDAASRNMMFINSLDKFCPVDVPKNATTPFEFGIFLDSLKNGNVGSINFGKKFLYSFWWGLRNLSNFGTNLETSTYAWENYFAILTSVIGWLLFLYLIGQVQTYISILTENSDAERDKKLTRKEEFQVFQRWMKEHNVSKEMTGEMNVVKRNWDNKKLRMKKLEIQCWMKEHNLTKEITQEMNVHVRQNWEDVKDAGIENLFHILPGRTRMQLKKHICSEKLQRVLKGVEATKKKPGQEIKDSIREKVLTSICDFLKPVIYPDGSYVYRIGEPLDRMLLITDGLIWTYNTTSLQRSISYGSTIQDESHGTGSTCLGKGSVYGEELLSWASDSLKFLDNLLMSKANVKAHGKVEGFILMAKDLKVVVDKHPFYWYSPDSEVRKEAAGQIIKKAIRQYKQQFKALQSETSKVPDTSASPAASPAMLSIAIGCCSRPVVLEIP